MSTIPQEVKPVAGLLTQSEARQQARAMNASRAVPRVVAVAHTVPLNCWGGTELGWSVSWVSVNA